MVFKVLPKYPDIAKNAAWQKQKSFKDKLKKATKTGLGEELVAAEAAFAKIDFNKLDVNRLRTAGKQPLTTPEAVDQARRTAQQHLDGPVRAAHDALEAAVDKASSVGKNAALSTRAGLAADTIAGELRKLAEATDPERINLNDFDAFKQEVKRALDVRVKNSHDKLKSLLSDLSHAADMAEQLPTVAEYAELHKLVQDINDGLSKSDESMLNVWGKQNWAKLAQPSFQPTRDDMVKTKVKTVRAAMKELKDFV